MDPTNLTQRGLVLIVDDRKNWRETLEELLRADGHRVQTAGDLAEARSLLSAADFDVAILDIRLLDEARYDIQGLQLLKEIRASGDRPRVLILTGYVPPDTEARVKEVGADVFLFKSPPQGLDIVQFRQIIQQLVLQAQAPQS